jgi:hypothetical protein
MYISEIDDILDKTLDKFMYAWILEPKFKEIISFETLIKEPNFVKYQKNINELIEFAIDLIDEKEINKLVSKSSNVLLIKNIISTYIAYYLFLTISINYKSKIDLFNNNLIEFSRHQVNYKLQINNFFNSESNSNIIKNSSLVHEIFDYANTINSKKNNDVIENFSINFQDFFKNYEETVKRFVSIMTSYNKDKIIIDHNIIKTIIYLNIYKSTEKKEIFNIIESTETSNTEFIFIDVVVPKSSFIDFNLIEGVLDSYEINTNLPENIYNLVNENFSENINEARKYYSDFELKIQKLLDTHIIIPIVDDFLLFHKNNEKYERKDKFVDKTDNTPKKKDENKIKYIINKLNTVTDYYKNPTDIKKLFYVPLQDRNAVLVNTFEDLKIISKIKNVSKTNNELIDLFGELVTYKLYPYISFKDFDKTSFIFSSDKTISATRNISYQNIKKKDFNTIQNRIISEDMIVNIVGFAIIQNDNDIECLNTNSFVNVCDETDTPLDVIKVLLENKMRQKIYPNSKNNYNLDKNYYWLFDLEKQKHSIPYYDISPNMPKNDVMKIIAAYLYDFLMESIINIIKEEIKDSHPKNISEYITNFEKIKGKYYDISNQQYSKDINELEYLMYYVKSKKTNDLYDYNEDLFPGLYGDIYKLPIIPPKSLPKIPKIQFTPDFNVSIPTNLESVIKKSFEEDKDNEVEEFETNEHINAICQHNISWDKLNLLKNNHKERYSNLVYEFIQQYVTISANQTLICKSCKSQLNIKKYILDGQFDNATQTFVTFSIHMDQNLEEMPEYERFKTSVRSLDKIIDRICSIINLQGLTGFSYQVRAKRRNVVKDVIDSVLINNKYLLKSSYLHNRDKFVHQFGINKNLSNFYRFELENTIFIYSSKEKDFYKFLKYNNIIAYILINIILEMSDTQITSLNNDKICSYYIYKKIGFSLFENLRIIVNKSGDIKPLSDFPVLCYIIYLTSCFVTKYNLWIDTLHESTNAVAKKKFNPIVQKSIINTVVEIFNTMLSVNAEEEKKRKIYFYEVFQTKYYFKLDLFKDFNIIKKLDKMYLSEGLTKAEKYGLLESNRFDIEPTNTYQNPYTIDNLWEKYSKKYCLERFIIPKIVKKTSNMSEISNLSNCIDGQFHNFKTTDSNFVCTNCNIKSNIDDFIPESVKVIGKRYIILYLRKLATKYCNTGLMHQFKYIGDKDINVCYKCNYQQGKFITYTDKELFELYDKIETFKQKNNLLIEKLILNSKNSISEFNDKLKKMFNKIVYKFQKNDNNINNSINVLLDLIQKLLGKDIIVEGKTYSLYDNIYIIDHDYNGNKLDKPILVYEEEKKFRYVYNHPHFKRDVIIYTMQKNTKYELFYDLQEKYLLGYREINKEYIDSKKILSKLEVNYSIKNILTLIGFTRTNPNLRDFYPEIYGMTEQAFKDKFKNYNMNIFINKIANRRFNVIKKLGLELKKYINRFKYNYKIDIITYEGFYKTADKKGDKFVEKTFVNDAANNVLDLLYVKYQKKIENDIVVSEKNKDDMRVFLKHINNINIYLPYENLKLDKKDLPPFSQNINYEFIIKNDFYSNIVINYIYDEIIRIINFNSGKNTKINIIHFIIDIIVILFNQYNYEISRSNIELSYFHQIEYTTEFYLETQTSEFMFDALEYYSNKDDMNNYDNLNDEDKEKIENDLYDAEEEINAMDIGDENIMDPEGVFDFAYESAFTELPQGF